MSGASRRGAGTRAAPWFLLALLTFGFDQGTKAWANLALSDHWIEVTGFFNLVLLRNTGSAFSFLADAGGWQQIFFSAVALVISGAMCWMILKGPDNPWSKAAAALLIGGALGNLADRLILGAVTDFLDFHAGALHWPAFNVADSAICLGAAIFLALELKKKDRPGSEK